MVYDKQRNTPRRSHLSWIIFERAVDKNKEDEAEISLHRVKFNNIRFADDIDIIVKDEEDLDRMVKD